MPARKKSSLPALPPLRPVRIIRRVAQGALLVVGLKAAQFSGEEISENRMFDRGLLDKLRAPLTRYHE